MKDAFRPSGYLARNPSPPSPPPLSLRQSPAPSARKPRPRRLGDADSPRQALPQDCDQLVLDICADMEAFLESL